MKGILILIVSLIFTTSVNAQLRRNYKEPTIKVGVEHSSIIGAKFTLKNTAATTYQTTFVSNNSSSTGVGAVYNIEYVIKSRYGIGYHYGNIIREHEFSFGIDEINTTETVKIGLFDFRTYFLAHMRNGFKPNAGVLFGTYDTTSKFKTSHVDLDDESVSAKVNVVGLHIGTDFILDAGGVRFSLGHMSGKSVDDESITSYKALYDFNSTTAKIGFFLFF